jgi:hypothetical protein
VRYIQRRAAAHDSRIVTIGQLMVFAKTGDAWLLDPTDQLAARLARDGQSEAIHITKPIPRSRSLGRAATASKDRPLSIPIATPAGPLPSSATRPTSSPGRLDREISNIF